jgi:predicted Ser/Thr protein kinase
MKPGAESVVVKFSPYGYGKFAHKLLADHGMAPKLFHVEDLENGFTLIVMEHIADGRLLNSKLSLEQSQKLLGAIQLLHRHGFVHGDMRRPNVLWKENLPFIIDFDFAGLEGESTTKYPGNLNVEDINWADGVEAGGKILQVHDLEMLKLHFNVQADTEMEIEKALLGKRKAS